MNITAKLSINRMLYILFNIVLLAALIGPVLPARAAVLDKKLYVPLVKLPAPQSNLPHLLGFIGQGYWDLNSPGNINNMLIAADTWAGKKHSISAFFFDINGVNPNYNFKGQLEALWQNGYTPLVNLMAPFTAYQIAKGDEDTYLNAIATAYAAWINLGGGRKAFIAPLPEMNGNWVTYGLDAGNFKIAYDRIRTIFTNKGAPTNKAWWVFAPNGWSLTGQEFENYYPGDARVDMVGFSSYNFGFCAKAQPWPKWDTAVGIYQGYIQRMRAMAPKKPMIITQTGTTAQYSDTSINRAMKDQWLRESYAFLAAQNGVLAIMYYDFNNTRTGDCDWTVVNTTQAGQAKFVGYKDAAANSAWTYVAPATLSGMNLTLP